MHDEQAEHIAHCSLSETEGVVKLVWEDDRVEVEVFIPFNTALDEVAYVTPIKLPPLPARERMKVSRFYIDDVLLKLPEPTTGDVTVTDPSPRKRIFEGAGLRVVVGSNSITARSIKPERKG